MEKYSDKKFASPLTRDDELECGYKVEVHTITVEFVYLNFFIFFARILHLKVFMSLFCL